jgi:ring-1,2-phenylacetyl-CoA epoxidase subunit PaaD
MVRPENISSEEKKVLDILKDVCDPEVPVLTVLDLGIIRNIHFENNDPVITVTTTYSGCPATDMINADIRMALLSNGYKNIKIINQLSPPWTTDWMSEAGKRKLKEYGIAPPDKKFSIPKDGVDCPLCNSTNTRLVSEFGSTACKALYQCSDCMEPFDYFKCH